MKRILFRIYLVLAGILGIFILVGALKILINPDFSKGYLVGKEPVFQSPFVEILGVHMFLGVLALLSGILQFWGTRFKIHKWTGYTFVGSIFFASPAGLFISFYSRAGMQATVCFSVLAFAWFYTTWMAVVFARKHQVDAHRLWMKRAFLLTNAAVFLRLLSAGYQMLTGYRTETSYLTISWVSWVLPLVIFEVMERTKKRWLREPQPPSI